jgi:hypothetical protein
MKDVGVEEPTRARVIERQLGTGELKPTVDPQLYR